MVLFHGDRTRLINLPWHMFEISSIPNEQHEMIKRIGKLAPKIFREDAFEMFVPVVDRELDKFTLTTYNFLFVRTTATLKSLDRLRTVPGGGEGLVTLNGTRHAAHAIPVEDDFVQDLIFKSQQAFYDSVKGITVGSFIRLRDGRTKDYCGVVLDISGTRASIQVDLKSNLILVDTPVANLVNLDHVPIGERTWYYCPLVTQMVKEVGNTAALEPDLHCAVTEFIPYIEPEPKPVKLKIPGEKKHHSSETRAKQRARWALNREKLCVALKAGWDKKKASTPVIEPVVLVTNEEKPKRRQSPETKRLIATKMIAHWDCDEGKLNRQRYSAMVKARWDERKAAKLVAQLAATSEQLASH